MWPEGVEPEKITQNNFYRSNFFTNLCGTDARANVKDGQGQGLPLLALL